MRKRDAHRKLMVLLCFAMGTTPALLAGCSALLPEQKGAAFENADQMGEAFDQIVPGMTRADDLPHLGFDTAKVAMLSSRDAAQRFGSADPAVRACIQAEIYCTGFVFHTAARHADLFQRISHSERPPGDITLLVMNGRVIYKVFSGPAQVAHAASAI
jgi:hypothetical protein